MGDIVNLNKYRKNRDKAAADRQAAENRVRSGQSKPTKIRQRIETDRNEAELDGKKLD
jgi:hypothetical protein